jgi:uncharacterized membrane protein (UPF0127 family)
MEAVTLRRPVSLVAALLLALAPALHAAAPEIPLHLPSGRTITAELMLTPEDRSRGLMFRKSLPQDRGLLFVFEEAGHYPFWMKNCNFPIDIVWLDEAGRVVYVAEKVPHCQKDPCPNYGPSGPSKPALYVLEINAGQAQREKIVRGAKLDFKLLR